MASFPQRIPGGQATARALFTPMPQAALALPMVQAMAMATATAQARP